jgi:hypothetical protein
MQTKNITVMQWQSVHENECLCIESYTYQHTAESPAFDRGEYNSKEYSTWAESRLVDDWHGNTVRNAHPLHVHVY